MLDYEYVYKAFVKSNVTLTILGAEYYMNVRLPGRSSISTFSLMKSTIPTLLLKRQRCGSTGNPANSWKWIGLAVPWLLLLA